jgi:CheY-like chemotaxis protein
MSLPLLATAGQPADILIVDDVCTTGPLVYLLHSLGYWATRSASCGESALNLAQDFLPSIVLITLQLPDMSAYRVAARLRDQARGKPLRLIALTTDYVHTGRDLARQSGFERYLAKPVGAVALRQLLRPQLP